MLLLYVLTVGFLFLIILWFITLWDSPSAYGFYVTIGIALTNILTLRTAFDLALYTADSWRELLRQGHFSRHEDLALDYLRYLESRGVDGRLPGAVRWALGF